MKIVGLTGGIGSGKTTVASMFNDLGVPVFIADVEAKKLMATSKVIKRQLNELFGQQAYLENDLNKPYIANAIFNDKTLLEKMNTIIHPKVASHFKKWIKKQSGPYVINEAAILFENNSYKQYDVIITVTAPKTLKLERLLKRDETTLEKIEAIMKNQWTDEEKIRLSHYVIVNSDLEKTREQVVKIHQQIIDNQ
ncbi:MAG: dephospho-CoA kinase [Flavobacteriales bacterium]|nr:dephospho-CoA kinase [Flavobacteriia bacterium]NCP05619.1 dephospho-CoA kinase [Flavobacteriales bacterium]PIV94675.1 MAG: dephospho-CoA kinase [Flavobacteriaceae bacterium CG17_big_fil_post_rev_8_21_14_2_50_33_15]PIY09669.1 MAG: dephospho-CoA kinase [Flavobacteriaceae bacterium CG_4_10_14_3_um_filter_33_47]PJB16555.1 MAG: dephospho-CoA kinase [Flavobacteriaceae bacterium CG_4_9_14_3_um_filter_33_16]